MARHVNVERNHVEIARGNVAAEDGTPSSVSACTRHSPTLVSGRLSPSERTWGLLNGTMLDERDSSMGLVRGRRRGGTVVARAVLALALSLVMVGCAGKKRPFGEAVPGGDDTEDSVNSDGDLPGAIPVIPGMGGVNDEAQGLAPLGQEGPPGVGEILPGDAVGGEASAPCDEDAGSCVSTDDPSNTSACVPTGPRDCTSSVDNDCDGQPDNVLDDICVCVPESIEPCEEHPGLDGRGQCRAGTRTCILNEGSLSSDWGECEGSVGPGEQDSCSVAGDDTDCDGINNGGCPCVEGETRPCGPDTEDGICQSGTQTCVNGTFSQCVGAVFPASRSCTSNQDNDCDGRSDNIVDNVCTCTIGSVQACGTHPGRDGNGQCQAGSQRCEGRGNNTTSTFGACTGSVGPALQDTCAPDNDGNCNGVPNEGCACVNGQTRGCGPDTDVGPCQRGTQTCVNGSFGACQGAIFPAPRNCASPQDNDCDGRPDNTIDNVCECSPGSRRCDPAMGRPQICTSAGRWTNNGQACGSGAECSGGACACRPGFGEDDNGNCLLLDGQACTDDSQCINEVCRRWFPDRDADTHGDPTAPLEICGTSPPQGHVSSSDDCCDRGGADAAVAATIFNGQTARFGTAQTICPAVGRFDYDCDGIVTNTGQDNIGVTACGQIPLAQCAANGSDLIWPPTGNPPACGTMGGFTACSSTVQGNPVNVCTGITGGPLTNTCR
jgi:hypothetical protein